MAKKGKDDFAWIALESKMHSGTATTILGEDNAKERHRLMVFKTQC